MAKVGKILKKVGGGIRKKARITKAAGQLGARLARPSNQVKFLSDAARGKGLVLPGSKYIGPGNEMNKGKPVDQADANAYQHDIDYDNYLKKGHKSKDVYTGYSDADERLLRNTPADTPNGLAVNAGMLLKKGANKLGLTKRIRDTDNPEHANKPFKKVASGNQRKSVGGNVRAGANSVQPKIAPIGNPSGSGVQVREV